MICRFTDVTCLIVEDDSIVQSSVSQEGSRTVLESPELEIGVLPSCCSSHCSTKWYTWEVERILMCYPQAHLSVIPRWSDSKMVNSKDDIQGFLVLYRGSSVGSYVLGHCQETNGMDTMANATGWRLGTVWLYPSPLETPSGCQTPRCRAVCQKGRETVSSPGCWECLSCSSELMWSSDHPYQVGDLRQVTLSSPASVSPSANENNNSYLTGLFCRSNKRNT